MSLCKGKLKFDWTGELYCEVDYKHVTERVTAFIIECAEMRPTAVQWRQPGRVAYTIDRLDFRDDKDGADAGTIIQGHAQTPALARQEAEEALRRWVSPTRLAMVP